MRKIETVYTTPCGSFWVEREYDRTESVPAISAEDVLFNDGAMVDVPCADRYAVRSKGFVAPTLYCIRDTLVDAIAEADRIAASSARIFAHFTP